MVTLMVGPDASEDPGSRPGLPSACRRFPDLSGEDVEEGIERFAATLLSENRIRQLLNANPLHIDRQGSVEDRYISAA
jgi:hypothetical protein